MSQTLSWSQRSRVLKDFGKLHNPDFSVAWGKKSNFFFLSVLHTLELGMALRRGC